LRSLRLEFCQFASSVLAAQFVSIVSAFLVLQFSLMIFIFINFLVHVCRSLNPIGGITPLGFVSDNEDHEELLKEEPAIEFSGKVLSKYIFTFTFHLWDPI
jgi:hypothetical protein